MHSFLFRLRRGGFLDVRFATRFALKGRQIGQSAKSQRLPNEPHWSSAANAPRPLQCNPIRAFTRHRTSGSPIDFQEETRPQSDMGLQRYRHVAGGLIVGNEVRVSRTTEVNRSSCRADFGSVRIDPSYRSAAPLFACKDAIGENSSATPGDPPACSAVRSPCWSHIGHFRRLSR